MDEIDEIDALLYNRLRGTFLAQLYDPEDYEKYKSGVQGIRLQIGACVALNRSEISVRQALTRPPSQMALWAVADDGPNAPARFVLAYNGHARDLRPFVTYVDDGDLTAVPMTLCKMLGLVDDLWHDAEMRARVAIEI